MQSKRFFTGQRGMCALAAGLLTGMAAHSAYSVDIFVDADAAMGGNGINWGTAYKYLQDALAVAGPNDVIWVADGEYFVDQDDANPLGTADRRATFQIDDDIKLYGGFNGTETQIEQRRPATNVTILKGIIRKDILSPEPGCGDHPDDEGACEGVNAPAGVSRSCCEAVCFVDVTCCVLEWDECCTQIALAGFECCGPALHVVTVGANTTASAIIDGFTIRDGLANRANKAGDTNRNDGAGMLVFGSPTVSRCIFTNNIAFDKGSGAAAFNEDKVPTFSNCVFHDNGNPSLLCGGEPAVRGNHGGGFASFQSSPTLSNCLFYDNEARSRGGAISVELGTCIDENAICGEVTLVNCTIVDNTVSHVFGDGGGIYAEGVLLTIDNCIFYNNRIDVIEDEDAQIWLSGVNDDIDYSCIEGLSAIVGIGNIGDDPEFVDPAAANYRLQDTSPCVNAGNLDDTIIPDDLLDIDDNGIFFEAMPELDLLMRVLAVVDMGAYENGTCEWDLDGDCVVEPNDLILLLGAWGAPYGAPDLIELLGAWGPCACDATGATVPSLQQAFLDACLAWPADWNATKNALGTADQDRFLCYLDHYLNHCFECVCPHKPFECAGADPFK